MSISPKRLITILAPILAFMTWISLSVLLLLYGNDWWLSGLLTLTVFAWLAGLLVVVYQHGPVRAAAMGAVIASATYWLLALGPWFSTNVGPSLLTSRLLSYADTLLHGGAPQAQALIWTSPSPIGSTGSTFPLGGPGGGSGQITFLPQGMTVLGTPTPLGSSIFQSLGHWLFIWLVAALGGFAAFAMQVRSQRKAKPSPTPSTPETVGESPFGPAATIVPNADKSASGGAAP